MNDGSYPEVRSLYAPPTRYPFLISLSPLLKLLLSLSKPLLPVFSNLHLIIVACASVTRGLFYWNMGILLKIIALKKTTIPPLYPLIAHSPRVRGRFFMGSSSIHDETVLGLVSLRSCAGNHSDSELMSAMAVTCPENTRLHNFLQLQALYFCLPPLICFLSLGKVIQMFRAQIPQSLNFCTLAGCLAHCKRKLLWWHLRAVLVYRYKHKHMGRSFIHPLSKTAH